MRITDAIPSGTPSASTTIGCAPCSGGCSIGVGKAGSDSPTRRAASRPGIGGLICSAPKTPDRAVLDLAHALARQAAQLGGDVGQREFGPPPTQQEELLVA